MLPRIGVYEYDVDLHSALLECYCRVSNRMLLHHLVTEPLYELRDQAQKPSSNPYILREKLRKWTEYINETVGMWLPLPSWNELVTSDNRDGCFLCDECLCECLYNDGCEWEMFGDDVDLAYDLIDRLHTPLLMSDDVHTVVEKVLEANPEMKDLVVVSLELSAIYVVRSTKVEPCSGEVPSMTGFHAFEDLAFGQANGPVPAYVLDEDVIEAFMELQREEEERRSAC
jgi:hypothetical protein